MRVAILSDTHFPGRGTTLPDACLAVIARCDLIVHAGDLADMAALATFRALGRPLVAIHGNADDDAVRSAIPPSAEIELPGLRVVVTHNGGPEAGRLERMRRKYHEYGGVIFGHSHIPLHQVADDGFFILNPGSATDRRRQPHHTMVEMELLDGHAPAIAFWNLDEDETPLAPELIRR